MSLHIGIVGAMFSEIAPFIPHLDKKIQLRNLPYTFYQGYIADVQVTLVESGIGKVNAALCSQALLSDFKVTHLINIGFAGSLSDILCPRDFVIADKVSYHDVELSITDDSPVRFGNSFRPDWNLVEIAQDACIRCFPEQITLIDHVITGDVFIASEDYRKTLIERFKPACVDMESAAIGHVATANMIPFLILRVISDNADESSTTTIHSEPRVLAESLFTIVSNIILAHKRVYSRI